MSDRTPLPSQRAPRVPPPDDVRARLTAYEDALRGIAAAAIAARRTPYRLDALQTMLTDVEHHLSSLIALGFVPPNSGRTVTSSARRDPRGTSVDRLTTVCV